MADHIKETETFTQKVLKAVALIPIGHVRTYKEIATQAGNAKAARAVGMILHTYDAKKTTVPCHRVVASNGALGGYRWGIAKKRALLKKEKASVQ